MDPHAFDGRRTVFPLILHYEAGNMLDDGLMMRTGTCHWDSELLWVDWGEGSQDPPYPLDTEHWDRIFPVTNAHFAEESGAECRLVFAVEPLPDGGETSGEYNPLWRNPNAPP